MWQAKGKEQDSLPFVFSGSDGVRITKIPKFVALELISGIGSKIQNPKTKISHDLFPVFTL